MIFKNSIVEPFSLQEEYTVEEMANIWNNEIDKRDLQSIYDDKGNLQGYVSIQEDGDKLVVNSYDSNDNIVASETIPVKNGKYTSKAIKDTIEKVTGVYEQNSVSKTQDINTINLSDNEIRDIVKYNPDGREIMDQNYVDFMVERYKDNKNISGVETNTKYVESLLNETYQEASKLKSTEREIINKQKDLMINKLIPKIKEKNFKTQIKLKDKQSNYVNIILDIAISKKGLKENFNKSISNEKYAVVPYLDEIIKSSETGIIREESKFRDNIDEWYYLYNTVKVNEELYAIKIDIKKTQQGDRFYVHRLNIIKEGNSSSESIVKDNTIRNTDNPSTNSSIPQKNKNVKSHTDINNKSMQVDKNYTPNKTTKPNSSDDNVRSMKKSTSNKVNTKTQIPIDEGIKKRLINGQWLSLPNSNNKSLTTNNNGSSINNSIPQSNKNVNYHDTDINNKSMQVDKNYTPNKTTKPNSSDDNVRSMKKSTSNKSNTKTQIPVDENIQKELHDRIQNAILSKNSRGRTYLGVVTNNVANKVKKLLGVEITNRRHTLADNDIRHMIKQHGNPITEKKKGQIAITLKDIEKIPDIINNYDNLIKGTENNEGKTIRYIKNYSNNVSYVVEVVPEDSNALKIKTMWKKPVRVTNNQKTPSLTSKTKSGLSSSTSTNIIPQNDQNVKNEDIHCMSFFRWGFL